MTDPYNGAPDVLPAILVYVGELSPDVVYTLYLRDGRWVLVPQRLTRDLVACERPDCTCQRSSAALVDVEAGADLRSQLVDRTTVTRSDE